MPKRQIFYSFHYDNDVMRVQQIRNIGLLEGNALVSPNEWESIKRQGENSILNWINSQIAQRSCVIVLIGTETANRKYVKYEIQQAWNSGKGVVGIYIHNINCPNSGKCNQGANPFSTFTVCSNKEQLQDIVKCYNPDPADAYNSIRANLEKWVEEAIEIRKNFYCKEI